MEIQNTTLIEDNGYVEQKKTNPVYNVTNRLTSIIENLICIQNKEEKTTTNLLNDELLNLDFAAQYDVDLNKVSMIDASFFINSINNIDTINYNVKDNELTISNDNKQIEISSSLLNVFKTSLDAKKPVRLDFDKDVTVILRLDKDGKVQTHFIPGTNEVESYLKQNLGFLKQRFDDNNINYSYLGYSKYKNENSSKKDKKGEK